MKKRTILSIVVSVLFAILLLVCIYLNSIEDDINIDYDKESSVSVGDIAEGFIVKEKKYDYNGTDVMLLSVENKTENAYTIVIKSHFTKGDGTKKQMSQQFIGFPAGYQNYFVLQPEIRFSDYSYEIVTQPYEATTYAEYIHPGTDICVDVQPVNRDWFYNPQQEYDDYRTALFVEFPYECTSPKNETLDYSADFIIFDNTGEIYWIDSKLKSQHISNGSQSVTRIQFLPDNILWKNYSLPLELKGNLKGIMAIKSVELYKK